MCDDTGYAVPVRCEELHESERRSHGDTKLGVFSGFAPPLQVVGFIATRAGDAERGPLVRMRPDDALIRLVTEGSWCVWYRSGGQSWQCSSSTRRFRGESCCAMSPARRRRDRADPSRGYRLPHPCLIPCRGASPSSRAPKWRSFWRAIWRQPRAPSWLCSDPAIICWPVVACGRRRDVSRAGTARPRRRGHLHRSAGHPRMASRHRGTTPCVAAGNALAGRSAVRGLSAAAGMARGWASPCW